MLGSGVFVCLFGLAYFLDLHSMAFFIFIQIGGGESGPGPLLYAFARVGAGRAASAGCAAGWATGVAFTLGELSASLHHPPVPHALCPRAGLLQATGWPSVVSVMANWFGKGKRGLIMGIWNAHTSIGGLRGQA